jgi:hypothetical protein
MSGIDWKAASNPGSVIAGISPSDVYPPIYPGILVGKKILDNYVIEFLISLLEQFFIKEQMKSKPL